MGLILFMQKLPDLKKSLHVEVKQLRAVSMLLIFPQVLSFKLNLCVIFLLIKSQLGISRSEDHSSAATRVDKIKEHIVYEFSLLLDISLVLDLLRHKLKVGDLLFHVHCL
jgi:hypothetical protein